MSVSAVRACDQLCDLLDRGGRAKSARATCGTSVTTSAAAGVGVWCVATRRPRLLVGMVGAILPGVASAHSGPGAWVAYLYLGLAPLLLCFLILPVTLFLRRISARERLSTLGVFLGVACVANLVLLYPDERIYDYFMLAWILPLAAVVLHEWRSRRLKRRSAPGGA